MGLEISSELRANLLSEAQKAGPLECCGLLLGIEGNDKDTVTEILPAINVSPTPHSHFEIDPATLIATEKAMRTDNLKGNALYEAPVILGYYHSHPNGLATPSATDAEMAAADGRYWVIIADGEIGMFKAVKNGVYNGRFDSENALTISKA
jgi:desampylase